MKGPPCGGLLGLEAYDVLLYGFLGRLLAWELLLSALSGVPPVAHAYDFEVLM